jgi:hypothetical protein
MDARKIVASQKAIKNTGMWAAGTMPRTAFPLSKSANKAYRLGNRRWRVVQFSSCGADCRLLINYSFALGQYQAMLGVYAGGDIKVLVSLERHPTHNGWHAHACCDEIASIPAGIKRGPWMRNIGGRATKYRVGCPSTDDEAFRRAVSFFRLDFIDGGGLV